MVTRREQALEKIRRLESKIDTATDQAGAKIEWEICHLQRKYSITSEEIKGLKDYKKMFPFLPESVIKAMKEAKWQ